MLAASLALDELERVEEIRRSDHTLDLAITTANAMAGKDGQQEVRRYQQDLRRRMRLIAAEPVDAVTVDDVIAKMRKAERIARRAKRKG